MSDAEGPTDLINITYTFDQAAAFAVSDGGSDPSGTYRPGNYVSNTPDDLPMAPFFPYFGTLDVYNGLGANGVWQL